MKRGYRTLTVLALVAMAAAACGEKPQEAAPSNAQNASFLGCQVTDTGGIDDRSFNATAWKGMQDAKQKLGIQIKVLESDSQNDFAPNLRAFVQQKCGLIVTVGFLLGDATKASAKQNPNQKYAIVDFAYAPKDIPNDNVLGLTFSTDQAAFLAGYTAAAVSKSHKLGTFGGINIPTVTIFMDGFSAGVQYYNKQKNASVQLLGWNPAKPKAGLFTGDFTNQDNGKRVTETLLGEGADIILPVAGPVGLGAAAAVKAAGGDNRMVWVDTDGCVSAETYCANIISSVYKGLDVAVKDAITAAKDGSFSNEPYVGTLENEGTGLSPFHDFDGKVPAELKSELDTLKADIISGKIKIESKSQPSE